MRHNKALVGLITVLFSVTVTRSNPFDQKTLQTCMKEANVADIQALKEVLNDNTGSFPEEDCLRKCLYTSLGIFGEDGVLNIESIKHVYQLRHISLSDAVIEKCAAKAEEHADDVCKSAVTEAHCFLGKIKFEVKS